MNVALYACIIRANNELQNLFFDDIQYYYRLQLLKFKKLQEYFCYAIVKAQAANLMKVV